MTDGQRTSTVFTRLRLGGALALATAVGATLAIGLADSGPAHAASMSQLNSELSQEQSRQQSLSASLAGLSASIGSLDSQVALVQSREAAVRGDLANDRVQLARDRAAFAHEQVVVAKLKAQLGFARGVLSQQLVSSYENGSPDVVSVVLDAHGFTNLLDQLNFLNRAEAEQKTTISVTKAAKARAQAAERRLASLAAIELQITRGAELRERALEGMNALLQAKQAALGRARAAQQAALTASRARAGTIQGAISRLRAEQQAAAQRAAAAAAAAASSSSAGSSSGSSSAGSTPVATGPTLGPSGGWAIPYAIVLCESGGQDLPPNSAGASGYYQILPSTWKLFGGSGPAAYLAPKAEQDAVASRIWNGGAGASNWVCARIVGIIH